MALELFLLCFLAAPAFLCGGLTHLAALFWGQERHSVSASSFATFAAHGGHNLGNQAHAHRDGFRLPNGLQNHPASVLNYIKAKVGTLGPCACSFWHTFTLTRASTSCQEGRISNRPTTPFPTGRIPFDNNGALYGTTAGGGGTGNNGTVFQLVPPTVQGGAWTENVLYRFAGGADGRQPGTGLVFDAVGNLYGSTQFGGNAQACGGGCGTIFELSPPTQKGGQWTHTVLYTFQAGFDGHYPGEVIFGANGSLYGTTVDGGTPGVLCHSSTKIKFGCGTVFEFTPPAVKGGSWTKTVLYTFPQFKGDGTGPGAEITFDSEGNLYGTTAGGTKAYGTVFELTLPAQSGGAWTETVLHDFTGGSDGGYPSGTVTLGPNGVLYGNGSYSGVANASGVVFELTPPAQSGGAWTETVLHTFPAFKGDATTPWTTLAIDQSGNLYGTSLFGGSTACYLGCGTIFKLSPPTGGGGWTESVLHDLGNSGQNPNSSLVVFHNGLLYGTTTYLGGSDVGSVFTLTP